MSLRDAAKQALKALLGNATNPFADPEQAAAEDAAITALRDALAEPVQEPVAWAAYWPNGAMRIWQQKPEGPEWHKDQFSPLYAHPVSTAPHDPVAWLIEYENGEREVRFVAGTRGIKQTPLFTAPPPRKPLTDEEMRECAQAMDAEPLAEGWPELIKFACAIERAHGIGGQDEST